MGQECSQGRQYQNADWQHPKWLHPNGYTPNGYTPNGYTPNGYTQMATPQMATPKWLHQNGYTPNGYTPNGYTQMATPKWLHPNGYTQMATPKWHAAERKMIGHGPAFRKEHVWAGSLPDPFGAFSHSAGTAPTIALFIPGTPPANHPPTEACMIHSKRHPGCTIQDPETRGYRWWKTDDFSHSAGTAHGAPPLPQAIGNASQ